MPSVSLAVPPERSFRARPGGIRAHGIHHRLLCALLEFSQSRLCQPCFFGQFQLSLPAKPRWMPRSFR